VEVPANTEGEMECFERLNFARMSQLAFFLSDEFMHPEALQEAKMVLEVRTFWLKLTVGICTWEGKTLYM
jgi:hypothetical protein